MRIPSCPIGRHILQINIAWAYEATSQQLAQRDGNIHNTKFHEKAGGGRTSRPYEICMSGAVNTLGEESLPPLIHIITSSVNGNIVKDLQFELVVYVMRTVRRVSPTLKEVEKHVLRPIIHVQVTCIDT